MSLPATPLTAGSPAGHEAGSEAGPVASGVVTISRAGGRLGWIALGVVVVMGLAFFWAFEALPLMDLPAHAGLIALRHRHGSSPVEDASLVVSLHVGPYTLFRGIGEALVGVIGPLPTVRVLGSLPFLATPAALLFARRRLHGDFSPTAALFGVSLSFGLMTLLGFASYLLGVAVLLVALTLWLELLLATDRASRPTDTLTKEAAVAACTALLFIAHGHAFVIFLALAGVTALATGRRWARLLRLRALAPAVALAAWSASVARGTPPGSAALNWAPNGAQFQGPLEKLGLLITPTLMTRTGVDSLLAVALWTIVLVATFASARADRALSPSGLSGLESASRAHAQALRVAALAAAAAFLVLPHSIGWFGFVDGRFVPLVLILCFLSVRRASLAPRLARVLDRGAVLAAGVVVTVALLAAHRFQREAAGYTEVLARVPAGARLLNLPLEPNSDVFAAHPFIHYDKLVLADRPVIVSDLWFHQGTGVFPRPGHPALALPSSYVPSDLKRIDWASFELRDWDFALVRTRPSSAAPETPEALELVEHAGGWWLYRRRDAAL